MRDSRGFTAVVFVLGCPSFVKNVRNWAPYRVCKNKSRHLPFWNVSQMKCWDRGTWFISSRIETCGLDLPLVPLWQDVSLLSVWGVSWGPDLWARCDMQSEPTLSLLWMPVVYMILCFCSFLRPGFRSDFSFLPTLQLKSTYTRLRCF